MYSSSPHFSCFYDVVTFPVYIPACCELGILTVFFPRSLRAGIVALYTVFFPRSLRAVFIVRKLTPTRFHLFQPTIRHFELPRLSYILYISCTCS
jgi:hypothetical protein